MSRRKIRSTEVVTAKSAAKASLRNLGSGMLELVDNTIKFHIEKGHLKKRKEVAREIPMTDVESISRTGNEFNITWKGVTDTFVVEETELVESMYEMMVKALKEQRKMLEDREAAKQKRNELAKILSVAIEIVDSLFDVLRSLQGRVDWNHMESLKRNVWYPKIVV
jgi:predicted RecB family nuclease